MLFSRREFHRQLTATGLMMGTSAWIGQETTVSAASGEQQGPPPIIDTHQHLWDIKRFDLPWLAGAPAVLSRNYLPSDYATATKGLNVVQAVYMEVDVAPTQQQAEAEYVLGLCQEAGKTSEAKTVGAVISGRPAEAEAFAKYIRQFKDNPAIKGVRQVLHPEGTKRGLCLTPGFVQSVQLLGDLGMSYDLCMRPTELSDAAKLVDQCPETRFVLDHCGNADPAAFLSPAERGETPARHPAEQWKKDIHALAERKNVICKISGIVAGAPQDWDAEMLASPINHCLDTFGPERVVFGGDWPVCLLKATYQAWVEALLAIIAERPLAEQQALLHDNAERFYRLKA